MWRIVEIVFWLAFAVALMASGPAAIMAALTLAFGSPERAPPEVLANLSLVSPAFPLVLGLVAFTRLKLAGENVALLLGFSPATLVRDISMGLIFGAIGVAIALTCLTILRDYFGSPALPSLPLHALVYFATLGAAVPGFCEELYYRGMLFKIAGATPVWLVSLLTSAGFALWHLGTPLYLAHTFLLGLMFAALTLDTGRLAPAILAHTFANVILGVLLVSGLVTLGG